MKEVPMFPPCTEGPGVGFHFYGKSQPDRCMHCGNQRAVPVGFNVAPYFELVPALTPETAALVAGGSKIVRTSSERETIAREVLPSAVSGYLAGTVDGGATTLVDFVFKVADAFIKQRDAK